MDNIVFIMHFMALCRLHGSFAESDYANCRKLLENNLCDRCFPESEKVKITRQRYQFADDRQRDSTTSSATAEELSRIASLVESRLVQGSCAKDYAYSRMGLHDEDDEHPSMFIEEVYATYGVLGLMNASGFEHLLKDLDIGKEASAKTSYTQSTGVLNQLRKRLEGDKQEEERAESTDRHAPNPGDETVGKCYSGSSLLRLFNLTTGIPRESFGSICPSLIEQVTHSCKPAETVHDQLSPEMYGWATLAVGTITVLSMLAMVAVPTSGSRFYATVMQLFVSLAVSSLSGDALLHLLPEALGIHGIPKEEGKPNQILVILTVVIAIYFFFVFERVMSLCLRGKPYGHGHVHSRPRRETFVGEDVEVRSAMHQVAADDVIGNQDEIKLKDKSDEDKKEKGQLSGDQIQTAEESEQTPKKTIFGLNTLVVMVLVGDIVHNITDGVTIGVSFVNGPFAGVSTAIAVFFHEVPHEIGDFAVMLRSGVSFKKAMFLSLISNLIGFVGLYAGLLLGSENTIQRWIYAATAGMFLYIALVSLIPEMNQQAEESTGSPWMVFMRHNVGLVTGWFIMLFIGFFEQYKEGGNI